MNGIINVLKPPGMTSFDVVAYLRSVLKTKKIGHTGTLDPGVAGVLPVCVGSATKAIEYIMDRDKCYRAELTLGVSTNTQDSSGAVTAEKPVEVSEAEIAETLNSMKGRLLQIPPMYSAVRVGGVKLYELARKGMTVERKPREVEIYSIDIIHIEKNKVIFDVNCSKGTYIRTLCADAGDLLGCGGHMSFLLRTKAGSFELEKAASPAEIAALTRDNRLDEKLIKVEEVFNDFEAIILDEIQKKKFLNGIRLLIEDKPGKPGTRLRVYDAAGSFIALGEVMEDSGQLKLKSVRLFI